jgi:hypothetical protein
VASVEELFAMSGSNVAALTLTKLLIVLPVAVTFTTNEDVLVTFTSRLGAVQLSTPVEPIDMGAHVA